MLVFCLLVIVMTGTVKTMFTQSLPFAACTLFVTQPLTCLAFLLLDFTVETAAYRGDFRPIRFDGSGAGVCISFLQVVSMLMYLPVILYQKQAGIDLIMPLVLFIGYLFLVCGHVWGLSGRLAKGQGPDLEFCLGLWKIVGEEWPRPRRGRRGRRTRRAREALAAYGAESELLPLEETGYRGHGGDMTPVGTGQLVSEEPKMLRRAYTA
ncbi:hypothetical protein QBC34DRAFT_133833 [Podospora aff. communis PSN243]|uniref:Transporter n=1 Tax=Podospora aff. communis PSN243 TaxID=3040156 RepID=A0AAV9GH60_9PEZI|nr:hypothetical protein QBC34DRAFT_133833 [Podospora aff. communis PSN243]